MDKKMEFNARERLKLVLGGSGVLLSACSGGGSSGTGSTSFGSTPTPTPITPTPTPTPVTPTPTPTTSLKGFYQNNFKVGGALAGNRTNPLDASASLALEHFSSITPEYELKADALAPTQGVYDFDPADRIVDWALNNGMDVRGHSLLWHEGTPDYFLTGSRDDIRAKLEDYINAVMTHFKGRITTWDVVNEVVSVDLYNGDAGIGPDRRTPWFDAVGNADYLDWAFIAARAADPDAVLFLNDYQTEEPRKQAWLIDILNRFESRGVPIDGVGHQFHFQLDTDPNDALGAIDAVDNLFRGLINHVTELDMSFYQDPGSCWETGTACQADIGPVASDALLATQAQAFKDLFDGLTLRSSVESVSFWGVRDSDSWLNNAPAVRYNYPLLFGRDGDPKPAFYALTDPSYQI